MHWYLVHTKPRQERCALENLQRQGYPCYLPTIPSEKLRFGLLTASDEPLFPRYLFIRIGEGVSELSWVPIRSTKGVSRMVSFGGEPARVSDTLVDALRAQVASVQTAPERLLQPSERVPLTEEPFVGIEGFYRMADGVRRAMVLIELLSNQLRLRDTPANLHKVG